MVFMESLATLIPISDMKHVVFRQLIFLFKQLVNDYEF
jgi:hypothetical protein